jgi:hypothetical protein
MIVSIADRVGRSIAPLRIVRLQRCRCSVRVGVISALIALALLQGQSECEAQVPAGPPKAAGNAAKPQAPPPPINYAFEREFAERMLKCGTKSLHLRNGTSSYSQVTQLPGSIFHIDGIEFDKGDVRREVSISDQDLQDADQLHGVSSLSIDIDTITASSISKFAASGKLRRLVLGRENRLPVEIIQTCPSVETVELQSLRDTQPWISQAARLPHLRTLVIEYPRQTVPDVADLRQSPILQTLRFKGATLTDEALPGLAGCRNLRELGLRQGHLELLNKPGARRPRLESLNLAEMEISGTQLSRLVAWCPSLRSLSLSQAEFDQDGWRALGNLTQIRVLSVTQTPWLDDELQFLPESLEHLTTFIVDLSCEGLVKHRGLPKLQHVALNQAPVTDAGLAAIVQVAPNLKRLFLSHPRITPAGARHLIRLKSLETVGLFDCEVPDACLAELRPITTLKEVRGKFSPEARTAFLEARPDCKLP